MVTAAALGDVVQQRGQQHDFRLGHVGPDLAAQREITLRGGVGEARHVAQHAQRVLVDGVDVEQVVLHAAEDLAERGQDRRQQAVPVHPPQRVHRRRAPAQQTQERGQRVGVGGQHRFVHGGGAVDAAHAVGAETDHAGQIQPRDENLDQGRRPTHEKLGIARRQAPAITHEVRTDGLFVAGRLKHFHETFGHLHTQPLHLAGGAVVALHELLHAKVFLVLVLEPQSRRQRALVVEQQPFLGPPRFQMQRVAVATQRGLRLAQAGALGRIEQTFDLHVLEPARMHQPATQPAQRIERAQATGAVLDVGLQVVGGVVVARVAGVALGQARGQVVRRGPQLRVVDDGAQRGVEGGVTHQPSRIQQAGEYRGIARRQLAALRQLAHGVAHFQADVPQRGEELLQRAQPRRRGCVDQRQQVHIRIRKQQAAAVAPHGEQRRVVDLAQAGRPHVGHHAVHRLAAPARQHAGVGTVPESHREAAIHITQQLPQGTAGIAGNARARHRHGQARQRRQDDGRGSWRHERDGSGNVTPLYYVREVVGRLPHVAIIDRARA